MEQIPKCHLTAQLRSKYTTKFWRWWQSAYRKKNHFYFCLFDWYSSLKRKLKIRITDAIWREAYKWREFFFKKYIVYTCIFLFAITFECSKFKYNSAIKDGMVSGTSFISDHLCLSWYINLSFWEAYWTNSIYSISKLYVWFVSQNWVFRILFFK